MNIKLCLFSLLFLINFWNKLTAQTIATDRPSALTENATTLYHQGIQIESGIQVNSDSIGNTLSSFPNLLLRYGLTKNIEIRIINDLFLSENKQITIGEFQIGSKIQLIKNDKYVLAFLPSFQLSRSPMDITNLVSLPLSSKFVGSYSFSNSLSAGYTIGYTFNSKTIGYSLLMSQSISGKITDQGALVGFPKSSPLIKLAILPKKIPMGATQTITSKKRKVSVFMLLAKRCVPKITPNNAP